MRPLLLQTVPCCCGLHWDFCNNYSYIWLCSKNYRSNCRTTTLVSLDEETVLRPAGRETRVEARAEKSSLGEDCRQVFWIVVFRRERYQKKKRTRSAWMWRRLGLCPAACAGLSRQPSLWAMIHLRTAKVVIRARTSQCGPLCRWVVDNCDDRVVSDRGSRSEPNRSSSTECVC